MLSYQIYEEKIKQNSGTPRVTYGIRVMSDNVMIRVIGDISDDPIAVNSLLTVLNKEKLDPVHIDEVIESYLYDFIP